MKRQYVIAIVIAAAVLLLAGAGILAYGLSQGGAIPGLVEPTPRDPVEDSTPKMRKSCPWPSARSWRIVNFSRFVTE